MNDAGAPRSRAVELAGEAAVAASTVVVLAGSSTLHVGAGSAGRAVLGSVTLGLGVALVLWTFGRTCAPQWSPLVSLLMAVMRVQTWGAAIGRILAQLVGAAAAGGICRFLLPHVSAADVTQTRPVAVAGCAFALAVVALGVAHYRDGRVPLAIGAVALMTFWMTGQPTLGNPLLLVVAAAFRSGARSLPTLVGAEVAGFAAGAAVGLLLHPKARESVGLLLFDPRQRS